MSVRPIRWAARAQTAASLGQQYPYPPDNSKPGSNSGAAMNVPCDWLYRSCSEMTARSKRVGQLGHGAGAGGGQFVRHAAIGGRDDILEFHPGQPVRGGHGRLGARSAGQDKGRLPAVGDDRLEPDREIDPSDRQVEIAEIARGHRALGVRLAAFAVGAAAAAEPLGRPDSDRDVPQELDGEVLVRGSSRRSCGPAYRRSASRK